MKNTLFIFVFTLIFYTLHEKAISSKMPSFSELDYISIGMPYKDLRNEISSIYEQNSQVKKFQLRNNHRFVVALDSSNMVEHATILFNSNLKYTSPEFSELKLVNITKYLNTKEESSEWFYAGIPEEGKLFKIHNTGVISQVSWVKPFRMEIEKKNIQELLEEFNRLHHKF